MPIEKYAGPSPLMTLMPNSRLLWCRFALSAAPAFTDRTAGFTSVTNGGTGIFVVTFKQSWPKGIFLIGAVPELAAGQVASIKLTSINAAKTAATIEYAQAASNHTNAPALTDGTTAVFLNLAFLAIER